LLAIAPNHPALLVRRGVLARQKGALDDALELLRRAHAAAPNDGEILSNLANVEADLGLDEAAAVTHDRAWRLAPSHGGVRLNAAGHMARLAGWAPRALDLVADESGDVAALIRAEAWATSGDLAAAIAWAKEALSRRPRDLALLHRLGAWHYRQGAFAAARAAFAAALEQNPDDARAATNLGLLDRNNPAAASWHLRALAIEPRLIEARFNLAHHNLLHGRWREGWRLYADRLRLPGARPPPVSGPEWDGRPLNQDESLTIWAEQGMGDVIAMLRLLPEVLDRARQVRLDLHPPLRRLVARSFPAVTVLDDHEAVSLTGWHCPIASLPAILATEAGGAIGYLRGASQRPPRVDSRPARVGLCWAGNPLAPHNHLRSVPLSALAPLRDLAGVSFHALQLGPGRRELATATGRAPIIDHADALSDLADTADVIAGLDLVISVDTVVLNLAGAMGVPAWGLLHPLPDFRWGVAGDQGPWYPNVRLFRRARDADGDPEPVAPVIARLTAALADWIVAAS
jgi:Flp pilus assembly protein TadD